MQIKMPLEKAKLLLQERLAELVEMEKNATYAVHKNDYFKRACLIRDALTRLEQ